VAGVLEDAVSADKGVSLLEHAGAESRDVDQARARGVWVQVVFRGSEGMKVVITIEDDTEDSVRMNVLFDPPVKEDTPFSPAATLVAKLLAGIEGLQAADADDDEEERSDEIDSLDS